jgi:hypothetical protein
MQNKTLTFLLLIQQSTLPTSFQAETGLPKILLTLLMSSLLPTSDIWAIIAYSYCSENVRRSDCYLFWKLSPSEDDK